MSKTTEAVLMLSGMIIGAGMFAIPFAFLRAGFLLGFGELLILTVIVVFLHRMYGDIVLDTDARHRMPGYVARYLGPRARGIAWCSAVFGISGSLFVYVLLGARFLDNLFGGVFALPGGAWVVMLVASGALITRFPLKKEAVINGVLTFLLFGLIVLLVVFLLPKVDARHFFGINGSHLFTPYGVLLFALSGAVVIPDVVGVAGRERKKIYRVITLGTIIPAFLYFLFAVAVVGASGSAVTEDAISGLVRIDGVWLVGIGSAIGFLAVYTSFVVLNSSFQSLLAFDVGLSPLAAWGIGSLVPLALWAAGIHNIVRVISVVGAVGMGIDSLLIIAAHHAMQRKRGIVPSLPALVGNAAVASIILAGVVYGVVDMF